MGTNFYARKLPTVEEKTHLISLIEEDNSKEIKDEVSRLYDSIHYDFRSSKWDGSEIHLGKRSGGWKFLWNPNIWRIRNGHVVTEEIEPGHTVSSWVNDPDTYQYIYPLTKEGIWNFINQDNIEIYDEYGNKWDKKEFFDMAINWVTCINRDTGKEEEAWDGKSYENWEISQGNHSRYLPRDCDQNIQLLVQNGFKVEWPYTDFYSDGLRFSTSNEFS